MNPRFVGLTLSSPAHAFCGTPGLIPTSALRAADPHQLSNNIIPASVGAQRVERCTAKYCVLLQICSVSFRGDVSAVLLPHPLDIATTLGVNRSVPEDL